MEINTEDYLVDRIRVLEKENDNLRKAVVSVQNKRLLDSVKAEERISRIKKLIHPYLYNGGGMSKFTGLSVNILYADTNGKMDEAKELADLLNIETDKEEE